MKGGGRYDMGGHHCLPLISLSPYPYTEQREPIRESQRYVNLSKTPQGSRLSLGASDLVWGRC